MIDPLGYLGALSQQKGDDSCNVKEEKTLTSVEKIMIAGVLLNAAALLWQISRSMK